MHQPEAALIAAALAGAVLGFLGYNVNTAPIFRVIEDLNCIG
ncbi:hypothetical protein SR1949_38580 [Sphaerospermopsis reniformis]|uniref:Uncharacterized protein n=1 Tax=Sphaerospermopsis reniformis TaxID=531300 RepID=A0A480A1K0_9CYAN|nr:hypothetical protein SR1949_38580 [Sphaerospermopsis reniformis]